MNPSPEPRVEFRAYLPSDHESLVQLWHDCDLLRPWNDPGDDIRQCLENPSSQLRVAVCRQVLCGSVMMGCDGHRGWVYYLAVDSRYRHRGIGRALMEQAEVWMRARDVPKIQALIRHDNLAVHGFYGRLNYRDGDVQLVQKWLAEETP